MGIGTEVYCAVKAGRRGVGAELKESYYDMAVKNIEIAEEELKQSASQLELF